MLVINAEIYFYTLHDNISALPHDLHTKNILRPAINFGNDILFSGELIVNQTIEWIQRGKYYKLCIEIPTFESDAFRGTRDFIKTDNIFKIQSASKVIGQGKIHSFIYNE